MGKYVARRLLLFIPTLWILTVVVFGLMRVLPGDVAEIILTDDSGARTASGYTIERLREKLGLNKPLHIQYLSWLWDTARLNLGESILTGRSILDDITQRFPITFQLSVMALVFSIGLGIPVGIISAVKQNSWVDLTLRFWSILFLAAPSFWLGLLVILAGSLWFKWVPSLGYNLLWEHPKENFSQLIWPALILAHGGLATMARMTRSTMLEVLREDYIRTARAKGLREQVIVYRHALKNALIPVVTMAGLSFATLMGGSVILEQVFGIPGMGSYLITAIQRQDYPVVQAGVVVFALVFMLSNLAIDLIYGWLDPRISYA